MPVERLPVHGFVLAGGQSSRMGTDKALLEFDARPLVQIAVEKLRGFCAEVSIAGNRDDLSSYADVVRERRLLSGPAAGVEAGVIAATQPWALFVPVDVPLVPLELLRGWAEAVLERSGAGCGSSFLIVNGERQPTFCMCRKDTSAAISQTLGRGELKLISVLTAADNMDVAWLLPLNAERFAPSATEHQMEFWFRNLNTPQEYAEAEAWSRHPKS